MLKARQEDRAALVQMWQSMEEIKNEQAKIKLGRLIKEIILEDLILMR